MNVYEMYYENGKKFGYWIRRKSWGDTLAKVIDIEGVIEGEDIKGSPPYFNDPKVYAIVYGPHSPNEARSEKKIISEIRCPGTYSYTLFAKDA
jgi:hypothetical protein